MTAVERVRVGDVLSLERRAISVDVSAEYHEIGVRSFGRGIFHKEPLDGATLGDKRVFAIEPGDLVISNVFAWEGAIALASPAEAGKIGSHRFMTFVGRDGRIDTSWAAWYLQSEPGLELIRKASPGSAGRNKTLAVKRFEDLVIPLPALEEQRRVAGLLDAATRTVSTLSSRLSRATQLLRATQVSLASPDALNRNDSDWIQALIGDVVSPSRAQAPVEPLIDYRIAGIYSFGRGLIDRGQISGSDTSYKTLTRLDEGNIVISKLNGWEGAVAVVDSSFHHAHVSGEFPTFVVDHGRLLPGFFRGIARSPELWQQLDGTVRGSMVRRRRISASDFMRASIWLPSLEHQRRVAQGIDDLDLIVERSDRSAVRAGAMVPALLNREFGSIS